MCIHFTSTCVRTLTMCNNPILFFPLRRTRVEKIYNFHSNRRGGSLSLFSQ